MEVENKSDSEKLKEFVSDWFWAWVIGLSTISLPFAAGLGVLWLAEVHISRSGSAVLFAILTVFSGFFGLAFAMRDKSKYD